MNSNDKAISIIVVAAVVVIGTLLITANSDRRRADDEAFARECNKRDQIMRYIDGARQCVKQEGGEGA